ncbi:hypothetical protein ACL02U_32605 [Streptomyces sp. MS06]|uniref:hypothetical protein n=1 Tax=Streptomyces sp. MS06 TaxID=3385974 RepID=UPI0039A3034E
MSRTAAQVRGNLSPGQLAAGQRKPFLQRMFVGSDIENAIAEDAAVQADPNIAHLGTSQPGQAVPDFHILDGGAEVGIDITGASRTSIGEHLARSYVESRAQILDYPSLSDDFLAEVFKRE